MKKGIARVYTDISENEIIFLFCKEGVTIVTMKSYVLSQPRYEDVELVSGKTFYHKTTITQ